MGYIKPEAKYTFTYGTKTTEMLVGVDKVTGTRIKYQENGPYSTAINHIFPYKGTGAEFSEIEAELVFEEITLETSDTKWADLIYKLPDVNQHVLVTYRYSIEKEPGDPTNVYISEYMYVEGFLLRD